MVSVVEPRFFLMPSKAEGMRESLAGGRVRCFAQSGKMDLSDWVELMEVVEALCPVWPVATVEMHNDYRL